MANEILSLIEREYADIREKNLNKARANLDAAMRDDEFASAQRELKEISFLLAKAESYDGDENEVKRLKTRKNALSEQRSKALLRLGMNEVDLSPSFDCAACRDTGFVSGKPCECFKKKWVAHAFDGSGLDERPLLTFANDDLKKTERGEKIYAAMKKYAENFPRVNTRNFTFIGPVGCGKTYLASIIAGEIKKKGLITMLATATELNQLFLKNHTARYGEKTDVMGALIACDFLVIDDLGAEVNYNNVTVEYFFALVSERLAKRRGTVITTNLTLDEIADRYGERFLSRISKNKNSAVIHFDDMNYRNN